MCAGRHSSSEHWFSGLNYSAGSYEAALTESHMSKLLPCVNLLHFAVDQTSFCAAFYKQSVVIISLLFVLSPASRSRAFSVKMSTLSFAP